MCLMKIFPVLRVFISSKNLSFICYARLCAGYFYIKSSPKENFPIKQENFFKELADSDRVLEYTLMIDSNIDTEELRQLIKYFTWIRDWIFSLQNIVTLTGPPGNIIVYRFYN